MKKLYTLLLVLGSVFTLNSCYESEISFLESAEDLGFTGSEEDIIQFLSKDAYNNLLALGVTVHTGSTPPFINGQYLMSPYVLASTNISGDYDIGFQFANNIVQISNQNNEDLSVNYYSYQVDENGNVITQEYGNESFITGTGSNFTVIIKTESSSTDSQGNYVNMIMGIAISGTVQNGYIQNLQKAFIVIEESGDINGEFIDKGEGRLIVDGDGFSEML
ncbi:MAG TPA: hypothetical protein VK010_01515 [Flavobacteriaceae bacterium]|nr:hypothetical protein [Flavobacteriaceae bacterium]